MKRCILTALLCAVILGSCFSPWAGDEGTLTINFGNSGSARKFVDLENREFANFNHTVLLKGVNGNRIEKSFSGAAGVISLPPGVYTMSVKASDASEVRAYGIHKGALEIKAGKNVNAKVVMYSAVEVSSGEGLRRAVESIDDSDWHKQFYILIGNSFNINYDNGIPISGKIALVAESEVEINFMPFHFLIYDNFSLGVKDMPGTITINGFSASGNLIQIMNGEMLMYDSITIRGNSYGAVSVDANSTFNMYGGKISGNTVTGNGGGVNVSGTFNMYGGVISGNTVTGNGGGVYVNGTFNMIGGEISDNTANFDVVNSTGGNGGGVYINDANFSKTGGIIYGNDAESNSNIANGFSNPGHAVYAHIPTIQAHYRNSTAGKNIILTVIDGTPSGGWEW